MTPRLLSRATATAIHPSRTLRPAPSAGEPSSEHVGSLFAVTLFLSAGLLFCVQPMVARALLPALGGTPAVWNTCMVFFQAALLAGYAYAHWLSSRKRLRTQTVVHSLVVLATLTLLPVRLATSSAPPTDGNPIPWLLGTLAATVGVPFLVLSTTAPLLQKWFAGTGDRAAADPYFLYAASNVGSMGGLLGYPLLIEPHVRLASQALGWSVGYATLALLVVGCGFVAARGGQATAAETDPAPVTTQEPLSAARWWRWVGLAFVPSSLMLGVTSYIATDIAAIPLLWVVPLALYLLTFILVFARREWLSRALMTTVMPVAVMLLAWTFAAGSEPRKSILLFHLATYFLVAMVCHGGLAADRPPSQHLTRFYLAMSVGGVLGGLFNAVAAPLVFDRVIEYPLVLGMSCLALPGLASARKKDSSTHRRELMLLLGLAMAGMVVGRLDVVPEAAGSVVAKAAGAVVVALGLVLFLRRPVGLSLTCLALLSMGFHPRMENATVLWRGRDFFGVLTVTENDHGRDHRLVHGQTVHGRQNLDPGLGNEPLTYYHRTGPLGDLFRAMEARGSGARHASLGVVGLGAGSMACYARPGQRWTFYEIDPAVARVARDPRFFTFLADCKAGPPAVLLGDARLRLRESPEHVFRMLVLDAFSSDAIPVHLLTREALALYRARIAPDGLLAFHISNRYIDLRPVLATLARDAGLICRVRTDLAITPAEESAGKSASIWAVMAGSPGDLGPLAADPRWVAPESCPDDTPWADDFTDIVPRLLGLR